MKFNWGTGIALTLLAFASLMGFMVYSALQQDFDLVSEDYYSEELKFQEVIDGKQQALSLQGKASMEITEQGIFLNLPKDFAEKEKTFEVHMYHELEAENDFRFNEENTLENRFEIPFSKISTGTWKAKVRLEADGVDYYFEPEITL